MTATPSPIPAPSAAVAVVADRPMRARDAAAGVVAATLFLTALLGGGGIWRQVNGGDLHGLFVPWFEYNARLLVSEGRIALWMPMQFCGTPALALGQPAVLYPPVHVAFALLPPRAALQAFYAFHVLVLAWGMAVCLRPHGVGPRGAVLGALVAVAGLFRGHLYNGIDHPTFIVALAWIPWMLHAAERMAHTGAPRWVAALAVATAMQWLGGYPDFALVAPVVLAVVVLVMGGVPLWRRALLLAAGIGLGAALAGAFLVPIAEAIGESRRTDPDVPFELLRSLFRVFTLPTLVRDLAVRHGPSLLLAGAALWWPNRTRLAWLAGWGWGLFALNVPFVLLYELPPYSGVRFPFGWGGWDAVLAGLLAAAGWASLRQSPRWAARTAGTVLAVAAGAWALSVVWRAPTSLPPFSPGNPVFLAPDLVAAEARARVLDGLREGARVLSEREVNSASSLHFGLPLVHGHEPSLPPRRVVQLLDRIGAYDALAVVRGWDGALLAPQPDLAGLLGTSVILVQPRTVELLESAGFRRVATMPEGDVALYRPAWPRARLVHRVLEADGEAGTLSAVVGALPERGRVAVIERGALASPLAEPPPGAAPEQASIVVDEPERVVIEAEVAAPALLVLLDTFFPGWRVTVDGVSVPVLRADHAFRGVPLAPGRHEVVFTFAPVSLRLGIGVSIAAILVVGVLALLDRTRAPAGAGAGGGARHAAGAASGRR